MLSKVGSSEVTDRTQTGSEFTLLINPDPSTGTKMADSGVDADRAEKTTENIRYGQNISESGMGGMTTTSSGTATQEGGYGGTEGSKELEDTKNPRTQQGYSAKDGVHDYNVGG